MADLVFVSIIIVFTALCLAYIAWCDHIIGPDEPVSGVVDVAVAAVDSPQVAEVVTL